MRWSVSKAKIFQACPRKWYYAEKVASALSKDPLRRETYLLKQLQSVYAWRGSLVDKVIDGIIVPRLKARTLPSYNEAVDYAMRLAEEQLEFGRNTQHRNGTATKTKVGNTYSAFFDVEYNGGLNEDDIILAKDEIKAALRNILNSDLIAGIKKSASYLISQRTIQFKFNGLSVSCTPDLLVFYDDEAPMIVDWKVHTGRNTDYWLQLGVYGYALSKVNPHKDFPDNFTKVANDPLKLKLVEFQLLKNQIKNYILTDDDVCDIEDYIHGSMEKMMQVVNGGSQLSAEDFATTNNPKLCFQCHFKKICWGVRSNGQT